MKTTRHRKLERAKVRFRRQFHSAGRVEFFRNLPCEVSGVRFGIHNAHTEGDGTARRGPFTSIVPLHHQVHWHFDTMSEVQFEEEYGRTKQSVRDRAPHYHKLWEKAA